MISPIKTIHLAMHDALKTLGPSGQAKLRPYFQDFSLKGRGIHYGDKGSPRADAGGGGPRPAQLDALECALFLHLGRDQYPHYPRPRIKRRHRLLHRRKIDPKIDIDNPLNAG